MTISPAGFFAKWCTLPTCKVGQYPNGQSQRSQEGCDFYLKIANV